VIFASDNGASSGTTKKSPAMRRSPTTIRLRSGKGRFTRGHPRPDDDPLAGVTSKAATCDEPVILTDLFHTCMHAAGLTPAADLTDGTDLAPLLKDPTRSWIATLCISTTRTTMARRHLSAPRTRDWKLLNTSRTTTSSSTTSPMTLEQHDLAAQKRTRRHHAEEAPRLGANLWCEPARRRIPNSFPEVSAQPPWTAAALLPLCEAASPAARRATWGMILRNGLSAGLAAAGCLKKAAAGCRTPRRFGDFACHAEAVP